jgi:hypothetical protein
MHLPSTLRCRVQIGCSLRGVCRMRLPAPSLRPSSAARFGSEWRAQNPLARIVGAAHERLAFIFARHLPFAAACRLSGMGDTPSTSAMMTRVVSRSQAQLKCAATESCAGCSQLSQAGIILPFPPQLSTGTFREPINELSQFSRNIREHILRNGFCGLGLKQL